MSDKLDLTKGITETDQYKAFKFPGGEIHFKSKVDLLCYTDIVTRLNTSDDILLLCIVVDTIRKENGGGDLVNIRVTIPYFPYAQADRNFGDGECFSLKTIVKILNSLEVDQYVVFDPHSDVLPALLKNCGIIDNSQFIKDTLIQLVKKEQYDYNRITILSPDAGAYKKIFHLAEKIGFNGEIECCNKYRNTENGEINIRTPIFLVNKDILIIDDICVGGKTFIEIAKQLKNKGHKGKRYLAISHGIFSNGFEELSQYFDKIFVTNSRQDFNLSQSEAYHQYKDLLSIYKIIN